MSVDSVLEVLEAQVANKQIEVLRDGQWCNWIGNTKAVVSEMQRGAVFRVKQVPRSIWVEEGQGGLTGRFWTSDPDRSIFLRGAKAVRFMEVME
jgi:hypothetical protein